MLYYGIDKAFTALGIGIAAVHKAVNKHTVQAVILSDVAQGHQMILRTVNAAGAGQAHDVQGLAMVAGIGVCADDFWILHDGAVGNALVDFHQILIHHAAAADVQMSYLAVAHLAVGQTHVLTAGLERAVRIGGAQKVQIRRRCAVYRIAVTFRTFAPTI